MASGQDSGVWQDSGVIASEEGQDSARERISSGCNGTKRDSNVPRSRMKRLHLYPKAPRDLTTTTSLGGALSLLCAATIAYLFVSNTVDFTKVHQTSNVILDDFQEPTLRIFFNITMENLPCQFASIDLSDIMGTQLKNVTTSVVKFKVAQGLNHRSQEFYKQVQDEQIVHEELKPEELKYQAEQGPLMVYLNSETFTSMIERTELVLVAFGAPWCPWTQRLDPVWRKTAELVAKKPYAANVRIASIDCTRADSQELCMRHRIHAFPTIRIYRHHHVRSHENYLGERTSDAFVEFVEEILGIHSEHGKGAAADEAVKRKLETSGRGETASMDGEGCLMYGTLTVSRVPGSFRIIASSSSHSFNTLVMNVTHHVDKLVFGSTSKHMKEVGTIGIEQRSSLYQTGFTMRQELSTLKHYLKVVPFDYIPLNGKVQRSYLYKANYNEYKPRKLEWFEGKADAAVETDVVPNAAFHYDISPVKVVMKEEAKTWASYVTGLCAVIGGIYTVIGLIDNVLYHGSNTILKKSL